MQSTVLFKILKSFLITVSVSVIFGYVASTIVGNFIAWAAAFTVSQFIIFYVVGEYIKIKNNRKIIEVETKRQEILAQQSIDVVCPCDRAIPTNLSVKLDRQNSYTCLGCNKQIGIQIQAKTYLLTTPVSVNPIDTPILVEHVEDLIRKQNAN